MRKQRRFCRIPTRRRGTVLLRHLIRDWCGTVKRRHVNKVLICTNSYFPPAWSEKMRLVLRELLLSGGDWNQTKQALKRTGHSRQWVNDVCEWGDKLKGGAQ
jgi:hypothetical protein